MDTKLLESHDFILRAASELAACASSNRDELRDLKIARARGFIQSADLLLAPIVPSAVPAARTFYLQRDTDATGASGTGRVAEGVVFSTGKVSVAWLNEPRSVAVYDSLDDAKAIHGHSETIFVF